MEDEIKKVDETIPSKEHCENCPYRNKDTYECQFEEKPFPWCKK